MGGIQHQFGHDRSYIFQQCFLIVLDRQHIVATLLHDLLGDRTLGADGINCHHRCLQVQKLQKLRDRRDFIGLAFYRHLGKDPSVVLLRDLAGIRQSLKIVPKACGHSGFHAKAPYVRGIKI